MFWLCRFNLSNVRGKSRHKNSKTLWYAYLFFFFLGTTVPTWCNSITVDLGMPRQCPRSAVPNASREHPVLDDRNIRCDRWLINHGGACMVSMGGLPLESTLWAGGQREHQLSSVSPGCITTVTALLLVVTKGRFRRQKTESCVQRVTLFAFHQQPQSRLSVCSFTVWKNGSISTLNVSDWSQNTVISTHKMWQISQGLEGWRRGQPLSCHLPLAKNRKWLFSRNPTSSWDWPTTVKNRKMYWSKQTWISDLKKWKKCSNLTEGLNATFIRGLATHVTYVGFFIQNSCIHYSRFFFTVSGLYIQNKRPLNGHCKLNQGELWPISNHACSNKKGSLTFLLYWVTERSTTLIPHTSLPMFCPQTARIHPSG